MSDQPKIPIRPELLRPDPPQVVSTYMYKFKTEPYALPPPGMVSDGEFFAPQGFRLAQVMTMPGTRGSIIVAGQKKETVTIMMIYESLKPIEVQSRPQSGAQQA